MKPSMFLSLLLLVPCRAAAAEVPADLAVPDPMEICRAAPNGPACKSVRACAVETASEPCRKALLAEAFETSQLISRSAAATAFAEVAARVAAGSDPLALAVRQRQDAFGKRQELERQLLAALADGTDDQRAAALAEARTLDANLADLDRQLALNFSSYAELTNPGPLSLAETQKLLRPDEALIYYVVSEGATFAWAVTNDGAQWARIARTERELADAVQRIRSTLDPKQPNKPFNRKAARALYLDLVAPFEDMIRDRKFLFLAPSGALLSLPFAVLVGQEPRGSDGAPQALRETQWFGIEHALSILPAPSAIRALRCARLDEQRNCAAARPRSGPRRPFAGFGAPLLRGARATIRNPDAESRHTPGTIDQELIEALDPLKHAATEVKQIAAVLGGTDAIFVEADNKEATVKGERLDDVATLLFATHALTAVESGGEAGLVFTPPALQPEPRPSRFVDDGFLTASEAALLSLDADWVILSACNTASGGSAGAESLSGLARAFLYAGARSVLVSHWPVDDAASARLTVSAAQLLRAGTADRAEAMRLAMSAMLNDRTQPQLAQPSMWAPFELIGEGRAPDRVLLSEAAAAPPPGMRPSK